MSFESIVKILFLDLGNFAAFNNISFVGGRGHQENRPSESTKQGTYDLTETIAAGIGSTMQVLCVCIIAISLVFL